MAATVSFEIKIEVGSGAGVDIIFPSRGEEAFGLDKNTVLLGKAGRLPRVDVVIDALNAISVFRLDGAPLVTKSGDF